MLKSVPKIEALMNFILKGSEISAFQLKGISKSRTSMEIFKEI